MVFKNLRQVVCALLVIAFCGAAIRAADDSKTDDDKKPKFELKSIAFKSFDLSNKTADVVATVEVKNAAGAFKLQDVNYRLKLNDQGVAEGKYEKDLEIPASGEMMIELPFTVDMTSIPGVAWNTISDSFTLRYELEAEFTIPLFAAPKARQKTSFTGDIPIGEAFRSLSNKLKEKIFGKP
jgi:LEA14-like dessication related protein